MGCLAVKTIYFPLGRDISSRPVSSSWHPSVILPHLGPVIPRHLEVSGPQPAPCNAGAKFIEKVIVGVAGICNGIPFFDHPRFYVQIKADNLAACDSASKPIGAHWLATHHVPTDQVCKRGRRPIAAPINLFGCNAGLGGFWCVDPVKSNSRSCNLDRIAVNDARITHEKSGAAFVVSPMIWLNLCPEAQRGSNRNEQDKSQRPDVLSVRIAHPAIGRLQSHSGTCWS